MLKIKLLNLKNVAFFKIFSHFRISKRQQFVIAVCLLTVGLIATQLVAIENRLEMVIGLAVASFILVTFVLREDLKGIEYLTLSILPTIFTVAVAFFYFLLPVRWLTRLPTAALYALGMYAILLTENIYNVAAERSIQLLRAAHSVGFLITLVTAFLLFDTIFSFHSSSLINAGLVFLISFPLVLQSLWSMVLEPKINGQVLKGALCGGLIFAQSAYFLSFWPINTTIFALFLATLFYSTTGILQQKLIDRLFPNTLREFLGVTIITFLLVLLTTRWVG